MSVRRMACTACGAEANASCDCGKAYVPAKQRAAEAIAANPQRSNRAIAEEIGADEKVVRRAREAADLSAPEREGRDGKVYRLPSREPEDPTKETIDSFFTLVDLAMRIDNLDFSAIAPTAEMRSAAHRVAEAWAKAERKLK